MFNPILGEFIAHEQYKDRIRQAERNQLANAASERQPAERLDWRTARDNFVIAVRSLFKALAHVS
jgi:hypothetical protein